MVRKKIEFTMIKDKSRLRSTRNKRLVGLLKKEMKLNRLTGMPFASFYFVDDQLIRVSSQDPDYMITKIIDHVRAGKSVQTLSPNELEKLTNNELKIGVRRGNRPPASVYGTMLNHHPGGGPPPPGGIGGSGEFMSDQLLPPGALGGLDAQQMSIAAQAAGIHAPGNDPSPLEAAVSVARALAHSSTMPLSRARLRGASDAESAESSSDHNDDMSDNDDDHTSGSSRSSSSMPSRLVGNVMPPPNAVAGGGVHSHIGRLLEGLGSGGGSMSSQHAAALRSLGSALPPGMSTTGGPSSNDTAAGLLNSLSGSTMSGLSSGVSAAGPSLAQSLLAQHERKYVPEQGGPLSATTISSGPARGPHPSSLNLHLHHHSLALNPATPLSNVDMRRRNLVGRLQGQRLAALQSLRDTKDPIIKTDRDSGSQVQGQNLASLFGAISNADMFNEAVSRVGTQPFADLAMQSASFAHLISTAASNAAISSHPTRGIDSPNPSLAAASIAGHIVSHPGPSSKFNTLATLTGAGGSSSPSSFSAPPAVPGVAPAGMSFGPSHSSSVSSATGGSFGSGPGVSGPGGFASLVKRQVSSLRPNSGMPPDLNTAHHAALLHSLARGGRPSSAGSTSSRASGDSSGSRPPSAGSSSGRNRRDRSEIMREASSFLVSDSVSSSSRSHPSNQQQLTSGASLKNEQNPHSGVSGDGSGTPRSNTGSSQASSGVHQKGQALASELADMLK